MLGTIISFTTIIVVLFIVIFKQSQEISNLQYEKDKLLTKITDDRWLKEFERGNEYAGYL